MEDLPGQPSRGHRGDAFLHRTDPDFRRSVLLLFSFFVIAHDRRKVLHFNVTWHPTAAWVGQQLREVSRTEGNSFLDIPSHRTRRRLKSGFGTDVVRILVIAIIGGAFFEFPASVLLVGDQLIEPAGCGPACSVVWQGRRGASPPYADCGPARTGPRDLRPHWLKPHRPGPGR